MKPWKPSFDADACCVLILVLINDGHHFGEKATLGTIYSCESKLGNISKSSSNFGIGYIYYYVGDPLHLTVFLSSGFPRKQCAGYQAVAIVKTRPQ